MATTLHEPTSKRRAPGRRPDEQLIVGFPGDYSVYRDRNLNGTPGGPGWHFNVMLDHDFIHQYRFTKLGALFAAWRRARRARRCR